MCMVCAMMCDVMCIVYVVWLCLGGVFLCDVCIACSVVGYDRNYLCL